MAAIVVALLSCLIGAIEVLLRWINVISAQVVPVLAAAIATVVGPALLQAVYSVVVA
jgi:hypothetical protein